jgi:hypothetical protein
MTDYIFLMHDDARTPVRVEAWGPYLAGLRASGQFEGGSAIGSGLCVRKDAVAPAITAHLGGFIRVTAASLEEARGLVQGNPVFESGGTIEIRELPRTD